MPSGSTEGEIVNTTQQDTLAEGLGTIMAEIRGLKREMKEDFSKFRDEFKEEVKREFASFKEEIHKKIERNAEEIQQQRKDITEAQGRVADLEEWSTEAKDAIITLLQQQAKLQEKLTEVEGRGRRCSLRIYNVAEQESESVPELVNTLLHRELALAEGTELHIQRAHRSFGRRPPPGAPPRSIVVDFLKYETKESVLTKAWKKKIEVDGRRIFFDHDYPTEVMRKRKSYTGIKKILQEKKIRFQTPLSRMRVHWPEGPKVYNNAEEVVRDMRKRGMSTPDRRSYAADKGASLEERLQRALPWLRVGEKQRGDGGAADSEESTGQDAADRARERLQEFRR